MDYLLKSSFKNLKVVLFLLFLAKLTSGDKWPNWFDVPDSVENLGRLCEDKNDLIGHKLGCDCDFPYKSPKTSLYADCSAQTLGTINTELPLKINVSSQVKKIIFSENFITELNENSFGEVKGVEEAIFTKNDIEIVEKIKFPRLSKLDLSHNAIHNLSVSSFEFCKSIEDLDLSFNALFYIEQNTFSQLKYLRILNLKSNLIGYLVELTTQFSFKLTNLKKLEELDLSNNTLQEFPTDILEGSENIKKLNLRKNAITHVPKDTFLKMGKLEQLDLSENWFNILAPNSFEGLLNLKSLTFDNNRELVMIEEHGFAGMPSLKELSCQKSHVLSSINLLAFKADGKMSKNDSNPSTIYFGHNSFEFIEYELLPWEKLEYLDLSGNDWNCDCNLQWVSKLAQKEPSRASILIDEEFICYKPENVKGRMVTSMKSYELMCEFSALTSLEISLIIIGTTFIIGTIVLVGLLFCGLLPESLSKKFDFLTNYPIVRRYIRMRPQNDKLVHEIGSIDQELEWDTGDMGKYTNSNNVGQNN